jgi:MSHA pilin protein MshC
VAQQRGFTMIELVVTMVIVGIMAVVILPRFDTFGAFDAAGFSDQLQAILRYGQKTAIAQRRQIVVDFTSTGATLCSKPFVGTPPTLPNCATGCASGTAIPLPGGSFRSPSGTTSSTPAAGTFCFDAVGRPSTTGGVLAATATVEIKDGGTVIRTIRIEPETGYVH